LKTGPFDNQAQIDHSKTGFVPFSDVHCIFISKHKQNNSTNSTYFTEFSLKFLCYLIV
jgi:hypothetical protein